MKRFNLKAWTLGLLAVAGLAVGAGAREWQTEKESATPMTREEVRKEVRNPRHPRTGLPYFQTSGLEYDVQGTARIPARRTMTGVTRSADDPRGTFTVVVPVNTMSTSTADGYYGRINNRNGIISKVFTGESFCSVDRDFQTGVIRNGMLYIPNYIATNGVVTYVYWVVTDLETGEEVDMIDFQDNYEAYCYNMTWDPVEDVIYGISYDMSVSPFVGNLIVKIDPKNHFAVEFLEQPTSCGFLAGICYNPVDKNVYAFNIDNEVFIVNKEKGYLSKAGDIQADDLFFEEDTPGKICFSPKDDSFVVAFNDVMKEAFVLYFINYEDWSVEESKTLSTMGGKAQISSIHCTDPFAPNNAPEQPKAVTASFSGSSLTGTYTFTVPELLYSGVAIPSDKKIHTVITLDGKVIVDEDFAPGTVETRELTVANGAHTFVITCSLSENLVAPVTTSVFHSGYDNPTAPTGLRLELNEKGEGVLTWNPSKSVGAHGGYVNPERFSYYVYVDGEVQNSRPLTECTYTLYMPNTQTRALIEVVCVGQQNMRSEPGQLSTVWGNPLQLPVTLSPTISEDEIFIIKHVVNKNDVIDNNTTFKYWTDRTGAYGEYNNGVFEGYRMQIGYYNDGNEWLFLPAVFFDSTDKMYRFTMDVGGIYTGTTREDFEVWYGARPEVESMTVRIMDREYHPCRFIPDAVPVEFAVPQAGPYYIGIHYKSKKERDGAGITLRNFRIEKTETGSDVPAMPADITLRPDEDGTLECHVTGTAPTKDALGNDLPADQELTITALSGNEVTQRVRPGGAIDMYVEPMRNGWNQVFVFASNASGAGPIRSFRQYIGIDTPEAPDNLRWTVSDDNLSMHVEWDAPSHIGQNGGFVDVPNLTYRIYRRQGVTYIDCGSVTGKTWMDFDPGDQAQYNWTIGPSASNEVGESYVINLLTEVLGRPNQVPQIEHFGTTSFSYNPITLMVNNEFESSEWANKGDVSGYLGESITFEQGGCLFGYLDSFFPGKGGVIFPKFTTKNTDGNKVHVSIRAWDYKNTPTMYLMARRSGDQVLRKIGEFTFERGDKGRWAEPDIILPDEYQDENWVQARIYVDYNGRDDQYVVIDTFRAYVDVENDVKIQSVSGPVQLSVGESGTWNVVAANSGTETMTNVKFSVNLINEEGKRVANRTEIIRSLRAGMTYELNVPFAMLAEYGYGNFKVEGVVEADEDMLSINNTKSEGFIVMKPMLPYVTDLAGKATDNNTAAELTWSEPDLRYGSYIDFETARPYLPTDMIGSWKNINLSPAGRSQFGLEGLTWPHMDEPQAWQVIDAEDLDLMNDTRLCPHSGKQYLMCRALHYAFSDETALKSSAWLVSPEIVGGSKLSFWMTTAAASETEYIAIYYSTTTDALDDVVTLGPGDTDTGSYCGDFKHLRNFSKSGAAAWELCEVELPADAKYVAIVYCSWDAICAAIDDIQCTPAQLDKWNVDHYELLKMTNGDWATLASLGDTKDTRMTDGNFADVNSNYMVNTYVRTDRGVVTGPRSNVAQVFSTDVEVNDASASIAGGRGEVIVRGYDGLDVALYTTDGKYLRHVRAAGSETRLPADAGIYLVKAGKDIVKVVVK